MHLALYRDIKSVPQRCMSFTLFCSTSANYFVSRITQPFSHIGMAQALNIFCIVVCIDHDKSDALRFTFESKSMIWQKGPIINIGGKGV